MMRAIFEAVATATLEVPLLAWMHLSYVSLECGANRAWLWAASTRTCHTSLLFGKRSKPVEAAAGTMQSGLSDTMESENALLTRRIPLVPDYMSSMMLRGILRGRPHLGISRMPSRPSSS